MGILDFGDSEGLSQLGMLGGLLTAKKGDNWGLLLQNAAMQQEQRKKQMMQEQMQKLQFEQMQQAQADQQATRALARKSFAPGVAPPVPNDDQGNAMPMVGAGGGMPEYIKGLQGLNGGPEKALGLQAQLAAANAKERVKVGPGETVGTYQGGKYVPDYVAPDKPPSGFTRGPNGNLAVDPGWLDAQKGIRAAGKTQITVENKQEGAFAQAFGKQNAEDYSNLMKSDAMASSKLNKLSRLEGLLSSSGNTGKLTPATMELKAAAESLGFKVDPKLPFQQAAQALSNEIALELRNPSGGAGMPGALSDRDREFLVNMVPNLAKTAGGNKMLIDTMKKLAQREKEIGALAREYRKQTGKFDEGFYQVLGQYSAQHPLFEMPQADGGWSATEIK